MKRMDWNRFTDVNGLKIWLSSSPQWVGWKKWVQNESFEVWNYYNYLKDVFRQILLLLNVQKRYLTLSLCKKNHDNWNTKTNNITLIHYCDPF